MTEAHTRYPLSWPVGRPRCARRQQPKFTSPSFAAARDGLLDELRRLGARGVILSTNVELRQDGLPYSGRRQPDDPGVAVYFTRKGRDLALACDRWAKVEDNLRAITDAIECIRTIERRGTGDMVDAAFAGFTALPAATPMGKWWEVLEVKPHDATDVVNDAYRRLVMKHHPDRNGGDDSRMKLVNAAYESFKKERGL